MMDGERFIKVSKEDFMEFISKYPRKLEYDWTGIYEPPLATYNDFTIADMWPDSVVAYISMDWLGPNGEIDKENHKEFWEYYIMKEKRI